MIIAPTKAPTRLPTPPRIRAEKRNNSVIKPVQGVSVVIKAKNIPPNPAVAEQMTQVQMNARSVSTPLMVANSKLSAVARIALPIPVYRSIAKIPPVRIKDSPIIANCIGVIMKGPNLSPVSKGILYFCGFGPQIANSVLCMTKAKPSEAMSNTKGPCLRSGLKMTQ